MRGKPQIDGAPAQAPLAELAGRDGLFWRLVPATAADHHAVHQLLARVFHAPSLDAFNASLDDPFYEPCDRLLVRRGPRLASHVLLSSRDIQWGGTRIPVTQFSWLGTLPEYRGQGFAQALVAAGEKTAVANGSLLGLLSTDIPRFFARAGWVLCGRASRCVVSTRHLLARLGDEPQPPGRSACIRPWRQVELPALMRLYAQNIAGAIGPPGRSEAYWRWLIDRHAFETIYVATVAAGRWHLDEENAHVVGYAVTKGDELLELMVDAARPQIAQQLLHRVCGDALEMDYHHLAVHGPSCHALGQLCRAVGGRVEHVPHGACIMVRVFQPLPLLHALRDELHRRAMAAAPRPTELGLSIGREKYHLALTRRSVKVTPGRLGRTYVRCDRAVFTRLLLGALDVPKAFSQGHLTASNRHAEHAAAALFPRLPLWLPPLDERME